MARHPSMQYPKTRDERVSIYLRIMEEIKTRLRIIEGTKAVEGVPPLQVQEICILQIRHICELVAIGCLAAFGKLTANATILNQDSPRIIMRELRKIYEHPFPVAAKITQKPGHFDVDANPKIGALTQAELEDIWANTGSYLHRLTVKRFLANAAIPTLPGWDYIDVCVSKIVTLLEQHIVVVPASTPHPDHVFCVSLYGANGNAEANLLDMNHADRTMMRRTISVEFSSRQRR